MLLRNLGARVARAGALKVASMRLPMTAACLPMRQLPEMAMALPLRAFSTDAPNMGNPRVWVGGLPYATSKEDLASLFAEFGTIEAIDMTSHLDGRPKGTCIITFASGAEAHAALAMDGKVCGTRWMRVRLSEERAVTPSPKPENCLKVFFANVPFKTTEDNIHDLFEHCGPIAKIVLMRDPATGRSKGYGFIDFEKTESTDAAVQLAHKYVQGRLMNVNYAPFSTPLREEPARHISTVFIANLPTDVDEDTLRAMFEHCGDIRTVRMPANGTKSFAHVTFASVENAAEALKLSGSEFDGRRLHVSMAINKARPGKPQQ
ncbi:hypothetical protein SDRG_15188, partial [Saprolegnia diclina VS20]